MYVRYGRNRIPLRWCSYMRFLVKIGLKWEFICDFRAKVGRQNNESRINGVEVGRKRKICLLFYIGVQSKF